MKETAMRTIIKNLIPKDELEKYLMIFFDAKSLDMVEDADIRILYDDIFPKIFPDLFFTVR